MNKGDERKIVIDGEELYAYKYPRPSVAVDCVIFAIEGPYLRDLHVLLVTRKNEPYKGYWALPGGFLEGNESDSQAASRELKEETNLTIPPEKMHFTGRYAAPNRDPRGRVISLAFRSPILYMKDCKTRAGDDAAKVQWVPITEASEISFDHDRIIEDALRTLSVPELAGFLRNTSKAWIDEKG